MPSVVFPSQRASEVAYVSGGEVVVSDYPYLKPGSEVSSYHFFSLFESYESLGLCLQYGSPLQ